jgi:hypothetical protein
LKPFQLGIAAPRWREWVNGTPFAALILDQDATSVSRFLVEPP